MGVKNQVGLLLLLVLVFLTAHPSFDVFLHRDAGSATTVVHITSLSSARRAARILSGLAYVPLFAMLQQERPILCSSSPEPIDHAGNARPKPFTFSEALLI